MVSQSLGSQTHLLIRGETFLRKFDAETVAVVRADMEANGCVVHTNTVTGKVEKEEDGTLTLYSKDGV